MNNRLELTVTQPPPDAWTMRTVIRQVDSDDDSSTDIQTSDIDACNADVEAPVVSPAISNLNFLRKPNAVTESCTNSFAVRYPDADGNNIGSATEDTETDTTVNEDGRIQPYAVAYMLQNDLVYFRTGSGEAETYLKTDNTSNSDNATELRPNPTDLKIALDPSTIRNALNSNPIYVPNNHQNAGCGRVSKQLSMCHSVISILQLKRTAKDVLPSNDDAPSHNWTATESEHRWRCYIIYPYRFFDNAKNIAYDVLPPNYNAPSHKWTATESEHQRCCYNGISRPHR
ncbi:Hypp76 [Branchiostoma lanceolatum]|uniref:Hypp76 protein n=1 Tax=Branchiostoma lanceolatum TaxID=7740 RepID=A0A8J9YLV4_BRALA|nr:Hypp76 [Branchiostoma lanceolatum]